MAPQKSPARRDRGLGRAPVSGYSGGMSGMTIPGGLLVAVEGIDGAGKTTLARLLRDWLEGQGAAVNLGKEPTAGPWGMKLRESAASGRLTPELERDYLLSDRRDHVRDFISPALARDEVVILDRYFPSMVAYQGAAGLSPAALLEANAFAPRPDVLLLLDLPPTEGLARIHARGDQPNAFEDEANLAACRQIFLGLPLPKRVIDATQPIAEVQADAQLAVMLAITDKLRLAHGAAAVGQVSRLLPVLTA